MIGQKFIAPITMIVFETGHSDWFKSNDPFKSINSIHIVLPMYFLCIPAIFIVTPSQFLKIEFQSV